MSDRESPEQVASEILYCVYGTSRTAQEDRVGQWIAAAIRARDAKHAAELAELQAQCAGMRAVIDEAMRMWAIVVDSDYERSATSTEWEAWAAMAAILPDAGKELLERVGEALTYIGNAKRDIPGGWAAAYGGDWKGWIEKAERRLRAALGEALP